MIWLVSSGPAQAQSFTRLTDIGPIVTDAFLSTGGAWNDFNNDGWLDMFALGENQNFFYVNDGAGSFTAQTVGSFLTPAGVGNAGLWADYDNDGNQDLFISNFVTVPGGSELAPNVLFRNTGSPDFELVPVEIGPELNASPSASWVDYDQDGDLDLYAAGATVSGGSATQDLFYRQDAGGVFTNIEVSPFTQTRPGFGTHDTWVDYDGDGDQDLFIVNWSAANVLFKSLLLETGNPDRFMLVTDSDLTDEGSVLDIGSSWADYDNDGDFDVFMPVLSSSDRLYENNGDGTFSRITGVQLTSGRSVMGVWGDVDNDGDLDIYTGSQSPKLYLNDGTGTFVSVPPAQDGDISIGPPSLQGGNFGDYDNDGYLDLFLLSYAIPSNRNGTPQPNRLLRNDGGTSNHWIKIQAVGTLSNRSAIGAIVSVRAMIGGESSWQHRTISGGTTSFVFHGDNRAHFGLGDATLVDEIRVEWPSGIEQIIENEGVDQILTVTEEVPAGFIRPNFYADQTFVTGSTSLTVQFTDVSLVDPGSPVTSWEWDFDNDGVIDDTSPSPSWTFTTDENRTFSVEMTISNGTTSESLLREDYIVFDGIIIGLDEEGREVPAGFALGQNYPNPFNPNTTISVQVPYASDVEMTIYNLLGERERRIFAGRLEQGVHSFTWDARRDDGSSVASGTYIYELTTGRGVRMSGKLVLVK